MRKAISAIRACLAACVLLLAAIDVAMSQPFPSVAPAPRPVDPRVAAAQTAFEALPEATRISIQNDLTWATTFSGAALGTFGRLTYEAISAFQKSVNQPVDGVLTEKQRALLAETAGKARAAMRFALQLDANTGSGIGIPATVLTKQEKAAVGSKWSSDTGSIVLETVKTAPDKADMPATFERFVNATVPGRKVTYKLLRPDFFVVTGEMAEKKFYTRFAPTPEGLRGYTITYNASLSPGIDKVVIAIANTFEPLKLARPASPAPVNNSQPVRPVALSPVQSVPTERAFTVLNLGGGKLLTSARAVEGCKSLTISGKTAQLSASEPGSGLALISADGLPDVPLPGISEGSIKAGEALFALGFDAVSRKLTVAPGAPVSGREASLQVGLQNGSAGSAVFNRTGQIVGLVTDMPPLNIQIAGVLPVQAYHMADAAKLKAFLSQKGVKTDTTAVTTTSSEKTTGELVQLAGKSLAFASCGL